MRSAKDRNGWKAIITLMAGMGGKRSLADCLTVLFNWQWQALPYANELLVSHSIALRVAAKVGQIMLVHRRPNPPDPESPNIIGKWHTLRAGRSGKAPSAFVRKRHCLMPIWLELLD